MRRAKIEIAFPFTPICGARQTCSHKVDFNFMNGNLIAPQVDRLSLLMTQPQMKEAHVFGLSIQVRAAEPSTLMTAGHLSENL
jgi:hypothetical protein